MHFTSQELLAEVPFSKEHQLLELGDGNTIPGEPLVALDNEDAVSDFLERELSTSRLKTLYKLLFLVSNRRNISPLHHQRLKGRDVLITERPDLHLLWYYERIFIKPIPKCLLSYTFWTTQLQSAKDPRRRELQMEAYGFLRTYTELIVHESDFNLARDLGLLPQLPEPVTWESWCLFSRGFRPLRDRHVALRYHYGEIRLTRLNALHTITRGCNYQQMHHNYSTFLSGVGAPFLFFFGAVTVLLTALQTGLAAYPENSRYIDLSSPVVVTSVVAALLSLGLLPALYIFFHLRELLEFVLFYRQLT